MTLARALQVAAGNSQESADVAEAIDFDGTNDFLRRTSDLTGNTDGKTFTFSFWTWIPVGAPLGFVYYANNAGTGRFLVEVGAGQTVRIRGWRTTGTITLDVTTSSVVPAGTFANILVSVDLANAANRSIYINDVLTSATWTTYGNNDIEFTCSQHDICSNGSAADGAKRLSNVYLDYTYRDLSITANRRLFVTADLKPAAGQAALNPILYLPMSDPTQPGVNAGTGGNFTLTGTVARSGRGPNQYNAPYSDLDGSADYLNRSSITGIADGKQLTISWCGSVDTGGNYVFSIGTSTDLKLYFNMVDGSGRMQFLGFDAAGNNRLNGITPKDTIAYGRNYVITISVDLTDTAKRHVYINGEAVSMTWSAYSSAADLDFTANVNRVGLGSTGTNYFDGRLGALWFNTSYIDLSVADNLAKFVTGTGIDAKPVDLGANGELPTGTSPLIYLPMYGNNAGKNYGTGGDFTVNSGPYTGARGPNEFWGNAANFDGVTTFSKLTRTTGIGLSNGKTFSMSFWFKPNGNESGDFIFNIGNDAFGVRRDTSDKFNFYAASVLDAASVSSIATDNIWYHALVCIDLSNTSKRFVYINGTAYPMTWTTYANSDIGFSGAYYTIGGYWAGSYYNSAAFNGGISEFYFTTDYIDFSQEANRLKFRDAFGNPVDLTQQIEDAAIPNPAIYMRFPPTSFGTNSGTGGNFTVNGTISDGGQL